MTTKDVVKKPDNSVAVSDKAMIVGLRKAIETQTALMDKIDRKLSSGSPRSAMPLLGSLEEVGVRRSVASRFYSIALGQIFIYYKERWDNLPKRFTQAHSGGYYDYILQRYGVGDQMCDMYSAVWEAFFSGKYLKISDIPPYIRLSRISIAKLRVAASYIMAGQMTTWRWKVLANDELERKDVTRMMSRGTSKTSRLGRPPASETFVLIKQTGDFRMYDKGGVIEELGHLNINSSNPRVVEVVKRMAKKLNIQIRR